MAFSQHLHTVLPPVMLIALVASGLGIGYYFTSARPNPSRVTWRVNPLFINFSSQVGSGSLRDSFTCDSPIAPVALLTKSHQPSIVTLAASPSSFSNCGSMPDSILVTVACTPTAQTSNTCLGDFTGKVTVCGPTPYTCLGRDLIVVITIAE